MEYTLDIMKRLLACDSPSGFTENAAAFAIDTFSQLGFSAWRTKKGCVLADLGGEGSPIVLSAHIDTLGGMVSEIRSNGRLRLTRVGGLMASNVECENCKIHTRFGKVFTGTMQLDDPSVHVNGKYSEQKRDFDGMEVVIDENTESKADTEALGISVGDFVCFDPRTIVTETGYIKSRFLDDKLSASILFTLAKEISEGKLPLKRKVYACLTVYEEVGHGCSAVLPEGTEELLCVDMGCVGQGLNCMQRAKGQHLRERLLRPLRLRHDHGAHPHCKRIIAAICRRCVPALRFRCGCGDHGGRRCSICADRSRRICFARL